MRSWMHSNSDSSSTDTSSTTGLRQAITRSPKPSGRSTASTGSCVSYMTDTCWSSTTAPNACRRDPHGAALRVRTDRLPCHDRQWRVVGELRVDSLAVLAALHVDGRIRSTWSDTGESLELSVTDGQLVHPDGHIAFEIPARRWWDDIVVT